jgi:hypothetical protein
LFFLLTLALLAAAPMTSTAAAATLFSDDFGPKPLESWAPSPLGLAGGWNGSAGTSMRAPVSFTTETIKGVGYAVFPAASGSYVVTYVP